MDEGLRSARSHHRDELVDGRSGHEPSDERAPTVILGDLGVAGVVVGELRHEVQMRRIERRGGEVAGAVIAVGGRHAVGIGGGERQADCVIGEAIARRAVAEAVGGAHRRGHQRGAAAAGVIGEGGGDAARVDDGEGLVPGRIPGRADMQDMARARRAVAGRGLVDAPQIGGVVGVVIGEALAIPAAYSP
ncbi:MAG: hypothetical protein WDN08_22085 [Rhizomicrobium sp.]